MNDAALARFMAKVDDSGGPDACWLWTASDNGAGYGNFRLDGPQMAHRVAYEHWVGPIPEGKHVDHVCHNGSDCFKGHACLHRRCVNPAHLDVVTRSENMLRGNGPRRHLLITHCPKGHPYDDENTLIEKGCRICRTCKNQRQRDRYWLRKAS